MHSVSDNQLIANACRWKANHAETGNGSTSATERRESMERMARMGKYAGGFPAPVSLTEHDLEYVNRLRAIAERYDESPVRHHKHMTQEQQLVLEIKGMISRLPDEQAEAVNELVEYLRQVIKRAGEPVGTLALALVGAEAQAKA